MRYFAGIDGGASKTLCLIGDESGQILARGLSGPANHQVAGQDVTRASIRKALEEAVSSISITVEQLDYVVLGLAGADLKADFVILNKICKEIFSEVPFRVVNDCWIGLRAGIPANWGVVTISGTGPNAAGRTPDGKEVILRGMSYELGNRGGGMDLVRDALHVAFRSEERTGRKTQLERELPKLFGRNRMNDLVPIVLHRQAEPDKIYAIPILVFELASKGDQACQELLLSLGKTLGEMAGGVIRRLGMENREVPITLIGGLFKGNNPLLIDEYRTNVHRVAPKAQITVAEAEPAYGAYLLAIQKE